MSSEPRSGRRWFQFSLRALLILILVVASFFAGLTYRDELNRRLRAEVEQAKAEVEEANRKVLLEQLGAQMAKSEAVGVILEAQLKILNQEGQDDQMQRAATLDHLNELLRKVMKPAKMVPDLPDWINAAKLQSVPGVKLQSPSEFWRSFQSDGDAFQSDDETPTAPIQEPKTKPEFQFDELLIDRTIGCASGSAAWPQSISISRSKRYL